MRNMSFALTTAAFRARNKTVTRRTGWRWLKDAVKLGQQPHLMGCEKCQGLRPGEALVRLGEIIVLDARIETLQHLIEIPSYGYAECVKEGFGQHPLYREPGHFVEMFLRTHRGCTLRSEITRIEFAYA